MYPRETSNHSNEAPQVSSLELYVPVLLPAEYAVEPFIVSMHMKFALTKAAWRALKYFPIVRPSLYPLKNSCIDKRIYCKRKPSIKILMEI